MPTGLVEFDKLKAASEIDELSEVESLAPKLIRRRSAPAGHAVVSDEVGPEMFDREEKDILNMKDKSSWLKT